MTSEHLVGAGEEELDKASLRKQILQALHEGKALTDRGRPAEAIALLKRNLTIAQKTFCPPGVEEGSLLNQLAQTYLEQENWIEARSHFEQALVLLRPHVSPQSDTLTPLLNNLGVVCEKLADFPAARLLYHEVLAMREEEIGLDDPNTVMALDNLAYLEQSAGSLALAQSLSEEVLRRRRRSLGERHPLTRDSLDNLAKVLRLQGEEEAANTLSYRAASLDVEEARANEGGLEADMDDRSFELAKLGTSSREQGNYADSCDWFEQALAAHREVRPQDNWVTARLISNLAYVHFLKGDLDQSEILNRQSLYLRQEFLSPDHPDVGLACNNLAQTLQAMGRLGEAEALMLESLRIDKTAYGEEGTSVGGDLHNLALIYSKTNRVAEAKHFYRQALVVWRRCYPGGHPHVLAALHNLSNLLLQLNDTDEALPLIEESVRMAEDLLGEDHPDLCLHLAQRARLQRMQRKFDEASGTLEQALDIGLRRLTPGHRWLVGNLQDLGLLRAARGDHLNALEAFREALVCSSQGTDTPEPAQVAAIASHLAWSLGCVGEYASAVNWIREALNLEATSGQERPFDRASLWNKLGVAEGAQDRSEEALKAFLQSASLFDQAFGQVLSSCTDQQRVRLLEVGQEQWDRILSLLIGQLRDQPGAVRAIADFVMRRKGLGTALLEAQATATLGANHPEVRRLVDELQQLRGRIASEMLDGESDHLIVDEERLYAWRERRRLLEEQLVALLPSLAERYAAAGVDCHTVASSLPPGSTLVEFVYFKVFDFQDWHQSSSPLEHFFGQHHYLAFILRPDEPEKVCCIDLGDGRCIDDLVLAVRAAITGEDPGLTITPTTVLTGSSVLPSQKPSERLRERVIDPLLPMLKACQQLILAPDGLLALVPFAALPLHDTTLLMDAFTVVHVIAGRDVVRFGQPPEVLSTSPVVLGDPDFDLRDPDSELSVETIQGLEQMQQAEQKITVFERLPGTRTEAEAIVALLGVGEAWTGEKALKGGVLRLQSPRILHLATHGYLVATAGMDSRLHSFLAKPGQPWDPLLSCGLALAGANWKAGRFCPPKDAGDGVLTALDVAGMDLRGTQLVVLSACETELGLLRRGDGLLGLRRSFLVAGARTLISSLWKVPDQATAELMTELYRHLLAGNSCAKALALAQQVLRRRYSAEPVAWGSFVCYGDPSQLVSG